MSDAEAGDERRAERQPGEEPRDQPTERPRPELAPRPLLLGDRPVDVAAVALRATIVVVGVVLVLLLAHQLQVLLLMFVVALIVASAMHAPSLWIERRGLPRPAAVGAAYLALVAVVIGAFTVVAQPLFSELDALAERGPQLFEEVRGGAIGFVNDIAGEGTGEELIGWLTGALGELDFAGAIGLPLQFLEILVNTVFIVFLSALLVMERDRARGWLLPFLAPDRRDGALDVGRTVFNRLGRFVHGQLLVMTVIGVGTGAALVLLGVPFALPLGLFAFLVEAIPLLGPWLAAIPITIVAFAQSPVTGVIVVGWLIVLQQIEGLVLTPAVQGKVQHLSPAVVLVSVLAGHQLFGVVGALIAVPVVSVAALIVERVIRPAREQQLARRAAADA